MSSYSKGNNSVKFKKMLRHKENIASQIVPSLTLSGEVCIFVSSRNAGATLPPPLWRNNQIINKLHRNDLTRSRRGLFYALL